MLASGLLGLSISERRACKHDVGADREPEGVIADDWYLDEHAEDREDYHNERSHKPKVHSAYLPGYDEPLKTLPIGSHTATCEICRKLNATCEMRGLIRATRVLFRL
jgi:hypothetical protein